MKFLYLTTRDAPVSPLGEKDLPTAPTRVPYLMVYVDRLLITENGTTSGPPIY